MDEAYRRLIEAWNSELNSVELQPLESDFYAEIKKYLERIRIMEQESGSDIEGMLRKKELGRATSLFLDLVKRRAVKIFESLMLGGEMPEESKLTIEEKNAVKYLEYFKKLIMEGILQKSQAEEGVEEKRGGEREELLIRLLKPLPKITGLDLRNYGPFEAEDLVALPAHIADPLIKRGIAVRVNWDTEGSD